MSCTRRELLTRILRSYVVVWILAIEGCSLQSLLAEVGRDASSVDASTSFTRRDLCGNGVDDDEDGRIDEGCPCGPREMQRCFPGLLSQRGVGWCVDGVQRCVLSSSGEWGDWGNAPCEGAVLPEAEICDGRDHDCDGTFDEGCPCTSSETRVCGPTSLSAPCMAGAQTCSSNGAWSECIGAIGPTSEICDGVDNDCDGVVDLDCACIPEPEVCEDEIDNDCDGRVDEPACRPDWPLCTDSTPGWTRVSTANAPPARSIAAVWTGTEILVWHTPLPDLSRRFDWRNNEWHEFDDTGDRPPDSRSPVVAWTGREMLVWGGSDSVSYTSLGNGAAFDPTTNTWRTISNRDAPSPREAFAAVWTGSELIVWGGQFVSGIGTGVEPVLLNDGGIYDPAGDSWRPMSTLDAPAPLTFANAVWTGHEMIVWGSERGGGGIFNPSTNTWRSIETANDPGPRSYPAVIWTGHEMAVWSGIEGYDYLTTGKLFDPIHNRWRDMNTVGAPRPRSSLLFFNQEQQVALSTQNGFIVWGGALSDGEGAIGAIYDAATETWTSISDPMSVSTRTHVSVWTRCSLFVWGPLGTTPGGGIWTPE